MRPSAASLKSAGLDRRVAGGLLRVDPTGAGGGQRAEQDKGKQTPDNEPHTKSPTKNNAPIVGDWRAK